jgi:dipeptidyl aminopeptidase/acylaminoacyl peptidase
VSASGGVPSASTLLGKGEKFHLRPSFLPDGRHFVYRVGNGGLYVTSLDSTARTLLIENPGSANVFYSRGHLLFQRETALMAQPFDLGRLTLTGESIPIADQVLRSISTPSDGAYSASDAGVLVYQAGAAVADARQLTWFDRTGKVLATVEKPGAYNTPALSPDGTRVVISRGDFQAGDQMGNPDLWMHEFARDTSTRLTFDPATDFMAAWSPDGTRIAWSSNRDGNFNLYQKAANGAGTDEALLKSSDPKYSDDWSPDGRFLLYGALPTGGTLELWVLPLTGDDRKPTRYLQQTGFNISQARFSPDSRFVAYTSDASGRNEVYVQPFPAAAGGKWMVSQGGGSQPRWRRDGKELFYIAADWKVMAVPVATATAFTPGVPTALFAAPIYLGGATNATRYDVTADGQKFLINAISPETAAPPAPITVVLN